MALATLAAGAQNSSSGFFNDGYMYRHNLNPAIGNRQSYFAMPVLGNLDVSLRGNLGVGDLVYSRGGQTVTFMHPDVATAEAVKPFTDKMRIETSERIDLLAMGFAGKKGRGYTTVDLSVRTDASLTLPGQLFRMAKEGPANQTYDLSAISANADGFAQLAVGHSHKIGSNFAIGAKVKVLFGAAHADATADGTRLTLGEDAWSATTNAQAHISLNGVKLINKTGMRGPEGEETPYTHISDVEIDKFSINNYGLALDLGATYTIADCFTLGLAVVDLGGIKWQNDMLASTDGPHSVSTDAFIFAVDDDADNSFGNEWERLSQAAGDLYDMRSLGDQGSRTTRLGATVNASAEFTLPSYSGLSFGLLSTTRLQGERTWNEERLSVNFAPCNWFALSLSGGYGTFGATYGGLISLHPKGFSLFAGMDCVGAPYSTEGIPLGRNVHVNAGLVFPF